MKRLVLFSLEIFLSGAATFAHAANLLAAESGSPGLFPIVPQPSSAAPLQNGSQANQVHTLSSSERAAIAKFVNANRPRDVMEILPVNVGEFGWLRVGGGKSDFAVLIDESERGYFNELDIYSPGSADELKIQEIEGWEMGPFKKMVRDLNGDGVDELVIPKEFGGGTWQPTAGTPGWPAVYRLENGRYVEDSRDFPSFYDNEILPRLNQEIGDAEARITREPFQAATVAVAEMTRDKILRVLGRNPVAGLNHAYQWMNSNNPILMQCAMATFGDIGGHEKEVRTLQQALPAAVTHEIETRNGG
jgi:hypothetical protein